MILFHAGDTCAPDFEGMGLGGFERFQEMYAHVSVDTEHASKVMGGFALKYL